MNHEQYWDKGDDVSNPWSKDDDDKKEKRTSKCDEEEEYIPPEERIESTWDAVNRSVNH